MNDNSSQPWLHQHGHEVQRFGTVRQFPLALSYEARLDACQRLNHLLVSDVIRTGELQAWFLAEHLVDTPLVRTTERAHADGMAHK